ncbi:MAG TPA: helix-turn-helix domain-containing protein [Terriglobales bacterium]|nr:helix-turn-helix domain-containing protein [Terriglobales bacterium]
MMNKAGSRVEIDGYVLDVLMRDLVGHDRMPAAFVVFLVIWVRSLGKAADSVRISLQDLCSASGLSKSAVQRGIRHLTKRKLISASKGFPTDVPRYVILRPWARKN